VNNSDPGNSGTSNAPFDTLAQAETASAAGHTVFVYKGDGTTTGYNTGYAMNANERLIGESNGLIVGSDTLAAPNAGATPSLTASNEDVVDMAGGNQVSDFNINPSGTGGGVSGSAAEASGTLDDLNIADTGTPGQQPLLELSGTGGTFNISNLNADNASATSPPSTAKGIVLNGAGTVNFASAGTISINTSGAAGLDADTTNMGAGSVFDSITVAGSGSGGIRLFNTTGTTQLGDGSGTDLSLTTTSGATAALLISSGGTVSVPSSGTANISATGGPAVDITGTPGITLALDTVSSTTSAGDGVKLSGLGTGTFSASGGTIIGAAGTSFNISGASSGDITYPGNLSDGTGQGVTVTGRTGGTVTFSGPFSDGIDAGGGILVSSNSGGSTVFSNGTKTINTAIGGSPTQNNAVVMSASDGHTLSFTGGGLAITTAAGKGLEATTSGTINVAGSSNTINTTTGTALNISDTDIGGSGATFQSIASSGAANGIVLSNTGSSGGLTVTGDGSNTSLGGNATGGTISNASGTDGTTAGIGVYLNNTKSVALRRMTINGTNQNFGIYGTGVNGLTLEYATVGGTDGTNVGLDEGSIVFDGLTGTSTFTKVAVSGSVEDNFRIRNSSGTSNVTIDSSTFTNAPNDNLIVEPSGTSTVTAHVTNNSFTGAGGDHFQTSTTNSATLNVVFTGNLYSGGFGGSLLQGITISGGNLGSSEHVNFNISNNGTVANPLVGNVQGGAINVNEGQGAGTWQGQVSNNIIGNAAAAGSGSTQSSGIRVENHSTSGTLTAIINGNTVRQWGNGPAINTQAGDAGNASNTGVLNVTVTSNTATNPGASTQHGFVANIGAGAGAGTAANVACVDVRTNTLDGNVANGGAGVRVRQREVSTVRIPGYTGTQYDISAVATLLQAQNPASVGAATAATSSAGPGYTNTSPAGSACAQPTVPT
jgi:hypothetical protein